MAKDRTFRVKVAIICVLGFAMGFAAVYWINGSKSSSDFASADDSKPIKVDWATLRELDLKSGKLGDKLSRANGKLIRMPGFMVPLEDKQNLVKEFLLVPSPQACVHAPAPPANQMLHVKMATGRETQVAYGPIWLVGKLQVQDVDGPYGKSGFLVAGVSTEPYTGE